MGKNKAYSVGNLHDPWRPPFMRIVHEDFEDSRVRTMKIVDIRVPDMRTVD
jgi:hypothetical protein